MEESDVFFFRHQSHFSPSNYDWIGFDLDHTLVRYFIDSLSNLIYECCARYFVDILKYDETLFKERPYDPSFLLRGIVLDKVTGCFLHLNHERKVVAAVHGTKRVLTPDQITALYKNEPVNFLGVTNERYWGGTSYFEIPYLYAFAVLVDWYDLHQNENESIPITFGEDEILKRSEIYNKIDKHIFACIEFNYSNWDKSWFFNEMQNNTKKYLLDRRHIRLYLEKIRLSNNGKTKVMLLTNSSFDYANILLNFAFGENWESVFDLKVFSAAKPYFFVHDKPFFELVNGKPLPTPSQKLKLNGSYSNGNVKTLNLFFQSLKNGQKPNICYFGDEVIGDVVVPRFHGKWDTVAIVEELEGLEQDLGLEHFMGLTPITTAALHSHPIWHSFFHYNNSYTSFWASLIHHYSMAYLPCVSRLTHYDHNKKFRVHHKRDKNNETNAKSDEMSDLEDEVPLCTFIDGGAPISINITPEVLFTTMEHRNKMRSTKDTTPLSFAIRKS